MKKRQIAYGEDIIVGVIHHSQWQWYIGKTDEWILDQVKLAQESGISEPDFENFSHRYSIGIVNEETADQFFEAIKEQRVDAKMLSTLFIDRFTDPDNDLGITPELWPALLVDFDRKILKSQFSEPVAFEIYVPGDWIGSFTDFLEDVPQSQRYWIIEGHDYSKV